MLPTTITTTSGGEVSPEPPTSLSIPPIASARLRKSVRIVSSKQVFPPGDEEEGEILYNLRIDVGAIPNLV
jgi:hypothetical protein